MPVAVVDGDGRDDGEKGGRVTCRLDGENDLPRLSAEVLEGDEPSGIADARNVLLRHRRKRIGRFDPERAREVLRKVQRWHARSGDDAANAVERDGVWIGETGRCR